MLPIVLFGIAVVLTLIVLGVAIPSWTQGKAEDPPKNPHFTRRVFGMRRTEK